jgi:cell wall-associated NlpC family hydrolase
MALNHLTPPGEGWEYDFNYKAWRYHGVDPQGDPFLLHWDSKDSRYYGVSPQGHLQIKEENMDTRSTFVWYLEQFLGTWYKWGGDDPSGFDCSGLICEGLQAVGKIPRFADYTARDLARLFPVIPQDQLKPGCLVFYTNSLQEISHVEMVWKNTVLSLGASGGTSETHTVQEAITKNAFVKIRPLASRPGNATFRDPFKEI